MITDDSKNAVFTGKELNNGGLWDVTPTIKKGLRRLMLRVMLSALKSNGI